jgi:hypothetical protein
MSATLSPNRGFRKIHEETVTMDMMTPDGDCELREVSHLQEWDTCHSAQVSIQHAASIVPEGHWELAFLYLCILLFSIWLGTTGEKFENIMGFSIMSIAVGFSVYFLGRWATDDVLRTNTKHLFSLTVFFAFFVCFFHFLRLKIEPSSIT